METKKYRKAAIALGIIYLIISTAIFIGVYAYIFAQLLNGYNPLSTVGGLHIFVVLTVPTVQVVFMIAIRRFSRLAKMKAFTIISTIILWHSAVCGAAAVIFLSLEILLKA